MQLSLRQIIRPPGGAPRWRRTWAQPEPHVPTRWSMVASHASTAGPTFPDDLSTSYTATATTQIQHAAVPAGLSGTAVPAVPAAQELADLPFYSQFPLDRRAEWRRDQKLLDELFSRPDAKLIPLLRDMVLVRPTTAATETIGSATTMAAPLLQPVLLCPAIAHADLAAAGPARAFLGVDALGAPYFATAVTSPAVGKEVAAAHVGAEWRSARAAGPDLSPGDAALLAVASGLLVWHGANSFSSTTGAPSTPTPGGYSRRCSVGGGSAYPRIDPAVIMLVSHQGFALLGRKAEWPADRYSTLAGFLELGEPLEVAVAREVAEEAGVRVDLSSVTYAASQPWPFPRSLMIGFHARAAAAAVAAAAVPASTTTSSGGSSGNGVSNARVTPPAPPPAAARPWWQPAPAPARGFDLLPPLGRRAALDVGLLREEVEEALGPLQGMQWPVADKEELQDVRWFHRDWLHTVFRARGGSASVPGAGRFNVPGPYSLAYRLITSWVRCSPDGGAAAAAATAPADPWDGDVIPQVLISGSGTFKYALARLWDPRVEGGREGHSKLLVWGDVRASYHNDLLQKAKAMARPMGLQVTPLGGGRIRHDPDARAVQLYGYSAAFGPAPHEVAAAIIHRWFPLYDRKSITVSYDGY